MGEESPVPGEEPGGILWTEEALRRVEKAPAFVRPGIYKLMVKRAKERGRRVITSAFLTEIRNEAMLRVAKCIKGFGFEELSMDAFEVAKEKMKKLPRKVEVIEEIKAFLQERTQKNEMILDKFTRYLQMIPEGGLPWTEEALAALQRIPPFVRAMARQAIEGEAKRRKEKVVTPEVMKATLAGVSASPERLPPTPEEAPRVEGPLEGMTLLWTAEAEERLRRIPLPWVRRMVIKRVETWAKEQGLPIVDVETYQASLQTLPHS